MDKRLYLHVFMVFICLIMAAPAWADNSRFHGTYLCSGLWSGQELAEQTLQVGDDQTLWNTNGYFYVPLEKESYTWLTPREDALEGESQVSEGVTIRVIEDSVHTFWMDLSEAGQDTSNSYYYVLSLQEGGLGIVIKGFRARSDPEGTEGAIDLICTKQ